MGTPLSRKLESSSEQAARAAALEDADRDEYLSVVVELAPGCEPTAGLSDEIAASIRTHLARLNSEFANYVPESAQLPSVSLRPAGDGEFFPTGVKHRYTRRGKS